MFFTEAHMPTSLFKLDAAIQDGFCLHGSPIMGLKEIEPRQAFCLSNDPTKTLCAVYADPHGFRRPIVHAVMHERCPGGHQWSYEETEIGTLHVLGENVMLGFGSVYILSRQQFSWVGEEFVSRTVAEVVDEVVVSPKTVQHILADLELEIPILPPW